MRAQLVAVPLANLMVESKHVETSQPQDRPWSRRVFTGWKVVASSASLWALQSLLWMQGFGNLAVELRSEFGWSKTLFSSAFAVTRAGLSLIHI